MEIKNLLEVYHRNAQVSSLYEHLKSNEKKIYCSGIRASFLSILSSIIAQKQETKHHIIIVEDREKASYIQNDIETLLGKNYSAVFPMSYKRAYQFEEIDNANVLERAEVLNKVTEYHKKPFVVITYPEALAEKVVNKQTLVKHSHKISVGDKIDIEFVSG